MQQFYQNKSVFVTGGSGFLGKVIIEKLLRSCQIDAIYVLIRSKKGKDIATRIEDIMNDVVSLISILLFFCCCFEVFSFLKIAFHQGRTKAKEEFGKPTHSFQFLHFTGLYETQTTRQRGEISP